MLNQPVFHLVFLLVPLRALLFEIKHQGVLLDFSLIRAHLNVFYFLLLRLAFTLELFVSLRRVKLSLIPECF
jgi:hypothetical protein